MPAVERMKQLSHGKLTCYFFCKNLQNFLKRDVVFGEALQTFSENVLCFVRSYSECGSKCVFLTEEKRVVHMKKIQKPMKDIFVKCQ